MRGLASARAPGRYRALQREGGNLLCVEPAVAIIFCSGIGNVSAAMGRRFDSVFVPEGRKNVGFAQCRASLFGLVSVLSFLAALYLEFSSEIHQAFASQ